MDLRSPNSQALRNGCREIAEDNWGFVYTNERAVQQKVNDRYAESDNLGVMDASEVTEAQIESALNELVERNEAKKCQEGVYFIDPFSRKEFDSKTIIKQLEGIFEGSPFATEEQLKEELDNPRISISDDEMVYLINELESRGFIAEGFSGTMSHTYYKPGESLTGHHLADLPPLSEQLEDAAHDGKITRKQLQSVLGLKVDDRIISELQGKQAIKDLGQEEDGPYLIYNESSLKEHVEAQVDTRLLNQIKSTIDDANYILEETAFEDTLLDLLEQQSNVLDVITRSETETARDHLRSVVERRCSYTLEKRQVDNGLQVIVCTEEIDTFVDTEARKRIRKEADGVPAADRPFIENEVIPTIEEQSYHNGRDEIDSYLKEEIIDQCRTIPKNEPLRKVIGDG